MMGIFRRKPTEEAPPVTLETTVTYCPIRYNEDAKKDKFTSTITPGQSAVTYGKGWIKIVHNQGSALIFTREVEKIETLIIKEEKE